MGFKVPDDLADKDLTLTEVKRILDNRKAMKRIQNRIDAMPAKIADMEAEVKRLAENEAALLAEANERRKAQAERDDANAEGVGHDDDAGDDDASAEANGE